MDMETIECLDEFGPYLKDNKGFVKPIIIVIVDGGPDENPRYPKTLAAAVGHFKRYDLDAIIITSHAPG